MVASLPPKLARIVDVARAERGVIELPKGSRSNRSPRIDQYRPAWRRAELAAADRKLTTADGKHIRQVVGEPWCAWFTTWCWYQALGAHPLGFQIGSCYRLAVHAQAMGLWIDTPDERTDLLFAAYPGAAFVRLELPIDQGQSEGHIGLVETVSGDGWTVGTIEGNSGDGVRAGRRELSDPKIRGIICPLGIDLALGDWPRELPGGADLGGLSTR